MQLIESISGVRGIVGDSLTPEVAVNYAAAFAQFCRGGKIVLGRDGRTTGKLIGNLISSTLLAAGCDVIATGVAPTPTIAIAVEETGAAGGISITASHNPVQWNGLKFIAKSGMFLDAVENERLREIARAGKFTYRSWDALGRHTADSSFLEKHIGMVLSLPYIGTERIRKRAFKIVADCINAAGGMIVPMMLRHLGCEVVEMNCDVSGIFSRTPEPVPENLTELCLRVVKEKADLGIAVDPDVDRLVLITEKGEPFGEEYTIATAVKFVLERAAKKAGDKEQSVVVNLSTTRAVDDIAKKSQARVFRTPVGEINVAKKMQETGAIIGGEGSGGVILPEVHYGRDAIVGIGLILEQMAGFEGTISEFKKSLPQYYITKSKLDVTGKDTERVFSAVIKNLPSGALINKDDGLKIDFRDSWVHLRKSNTEPIIRIIAEAPTEDEAKSLVQKFKSQIG